MHWIGARPIRVRRRAQGERVGACRAVSAALRLDHSATAPHALEARGLAMAVAFRKPGATMSGMGRAFGYPPSLDEIDALARAALDKLPAEFRAHLGEVLVRVEDFADEETLKALGIEDPFELTGIYEGVPLGEKSISASGVLPDRIRLFREPILDEWIARGDETLEHLVAHVLVHEVGHHFGLSDAAMHALEEEM